MATIKATVIADSENEYGNRLTTFLLRYPRWIHAEGRTHRQLSIGENEVEDGWYDPKTPSLMADPNLSRNASSSRAIPVSKLIKDVIDDPAIPMFWGENQKGMQAGKENKKGVYMNTFGDEGMVHWSREMAWLQARDYAIHAAEAFSDAGYHKQLVNRLLEPFSHINVVVTATEWSNFFALRRHKDAEPHIKLLADRMFDALDASSPVTLKHGEWHTPFVGDDDLDAILEYFRENHIPVERMQDYKIKLSVARCASTSYMTVDGQPMTLQRAVSLYSRLLGAQPIHASPTEHQGTPDRGNLYREGGWEKMNKHGNFKGFIQYRKTLPNECL